MLNLNYYISPLKRLLTSLVTVCLSACANQKNLPPTVQKIDPSLYAGEWHEIARLPNTFERGLVAAKATYSLNPDGSLTVLNEGLKANGKTTSIAGNARCVNPQEPGKLKVRFNRFPANLFEGDYWILDLNPQHTRALIGSPNRKLLWLLSKDPNDQKNNFEDFIKRAEELKFPIEPLFLNPKRME
jgi:apolipoprotein D and lipocalin family protein